MLGSVESPEQDLLVLGSLEDLQVEWTVGMGVLGHWV